MLTVLWLLWARAVLVLRLVVLWCAAAHTQHGSKHNNGFYCVHTTNSIACCDVLALLCFAVPCCLSPSKHSTANTASQPGSRQARRAQHSVVLFCAGVPCCVCVLSRCVVLSAVCCAVMGWCVLLCGSPCRCLASECLASCLAFASCLGLASCICLPSSCLYLLALPLAVVVSCLLHCLLPCLFASFYCFASLASPCLSCFPLLVGVWLFALVSWPLSIACFLCCPLSCRCCCC